MSRYFSNMTEFEMWEPRWCDRCQRDLLFRNGASDQGCPLLALAILGELVPEWEVRSEVGDPAERVACTRFKEIGSPSERPPRPRRPPRGQGSLLEALS